YSPSKFFLGGKSMGGRIASQTVAAGLEVDGLFFLGYPLHPPGRQDQLRDSHLYKINIPMLFVSGTRDNFARKELLDAVVGKLGSKAAIHWIENGDHSFNTGNGKAAVAQTYSSVIALLVDWFKANTK
ncbi:MAG TPA: alpha/beta family hydrolase, partial [Candidatus Binatus sp.]|nr:alpha/beta family hydrolase [Candidatus Binatus sp.]